MDISVVSWVSFDEGIKIGNFIRLNFGGWFGINDEKQYTDKKCNFKERHRWCNYVDRTFESTKSLCEMRAYLEAVRSSIINKYVSVDNARKHTGVYHQKANDGAPMFSDGKVGLFSRNAWGDLMAAIWTEVGIENNLEEYNKTSICTQYCYYDFR